MTLGLIDAKPIVNVKFFETWVEVIGNSPDSSIPDLIEFIPPIDSALAQIDKKNFLPNNKRKTLFLNMTFIFPCQEQFDLMSEAVELAGGRATDNFCTKNAILIETTNQVPSEEYSAFLNYLTTQGKRAIPMKEIGWAILTCSTHRYCNPLLNLEQTLFSKRGQASVQSDQLTILAPESQVAAQAEIERRTKKIKIEATHLLEEATNREPPAKKIKVEATQLLEEASGSEPPSKKSNVKATRLLEEPSNNGPPKKKMCLELNIKVIIQILELLLMRYGCS